MKNNKTKHFHNTNGSILKPVVTYSKLTLEVKTIFKDNKYKSGIYRWNNLITGARYIGSAVDLTRRLRDYFSDEFIKREIKKSNSLIYRALLKYGYDNFSLDILEYCDKMSTIRKEQYYIDFLKPQYNICLKAGSSLGRITRIETRLKLRNAWLNRLFYKSNDSTLREFIINSFDNKLNQSSLIITKLYNKFEKIKQKQVLESKVSFHTRMKILTSIKTSQTVLVIDRYDGTSYEYLSARRAAIALNASNSTIMNKLKGKTSKLYKGRYLIKGLGPKQF